MSLIFAGFGPRAAAAGRPAPPAPSWASAIDGGQGAWRASPDIPAATLRSFFTPGIEAGRLDESPRSGADQDRERDRVVDRVHRDRRARSSRCARRASESQSPKTASWRTTPQVPGPGVVEEAPDHAAEISAASMNGIRAAHAPEHEAAEEDLLAERGDDDDQQRRRSPSPSAPCVEAELAGDVVLLGLRAAARSRSRRRCSRSRRAPPSQYRLAQRAAQAERTRRTARRAGRGRRTGSATRIRLAASRRLEREPGAERLDVAVEGRDDPGRGRSRRRAGSRARRAPARAPSSPRQQVARRRGRGGRLAGRRARRRAGRRRRRLAGGSSGRRSRSEMLLDLGERGYLAAAAVAVEQQRRDARRAGAGDVLRRRVADVQRLAPARSRRARAPRAKIAGSGLRAPTAAEVTTPSSSAGEPAALEHLAAARSPSSRRRRAAGRARAARASAGAASG